MKTVTRVLAKPFAQDKVRFVGNVEIGRDFTHDELAPCYDAVVYASGTERDRGLDIPGETRPGVVGAGDFVRWYNGHPDAAGTDFPLDAEQVVVVGAGNVALDVARVLGRYLQTSCGTPMSPARVLAALARSAVRDVHILIRRAPADVKFTPAELFQLSELADTDVVVHDGGGGIDDPALAQDKRVRLNLKTLRALAGAPDRGRHRRIHLRFFSAPAEILGADRVEGVAVRRTGGEPHDEQLVLPAGLVVTAVGFRGAPLDGLPFSEAAGTVPNEGGRVVAGQGVVPGLYVAGWLKRGPSGIIGTNRPDGAETAAAVLADLADLAGRAVPARPDIVELLAARSRPTSDWAGWLRLEDYEGALGAADGRGRVKVHDLESMLRHCAVSV